MSRVQLPVSRLKARRRKRRALMLFFCLFIIGALLGSAVALSWASPLRIQQVDIVGVSSANKNMVEEKARRNLDGAYWYIFPKDNIFLYPKDAIRADLLREFPVFASVAVSARDFRTIQVEAVERATRALWCGEGRELATACLSLDEGGAAYALAADFSGLVYARYTGALPAGPLPRQFLTPDAFRALSALVDEFARKVTDTSISTVVVEGDEARIVCANGFTLIFSLADSGADVLERFTLALTAEPFVGHTLSEFEYLDLRFGDKLYYKLK